MRPEIKEDILKTLLDEKYIKVYDYPFGENGHYLTGSRRTKDNLVMLKSDEEYKAMTADAVSCVVIIKSKNQEPRILMNYEFRYACGRFLLAPPAGLIDKEDAEQGDPLIVTTKREIQEETGIIVKDTDEVHVVNPLLFSSPGMVDESNAITCAVVELDTLDALNHDGSVGSEVFSGFELLTEAEAREVLKNGRDKDGFFYSVYTWICLMYFVSGMWKI